MANTALWQVTLRVPRCRIASLEHLFEAHEEAPEGPALALSVFFDENDPEDGRIEALFAARPTPSGLIRDLGTIGIATDSLSIKELEDADWVAVSQERLPPVRIGRFFIYQDHQAALVPTGAVALRINAGLAFGTGHHASTQGCLIALDDLARRRRVTRALDMGCGSGLLALAIARAWPARVVAADIEPQAVAVTARNAAVNRLQGCSGVRIRAVHTGAPEHPAIRDAGPYDLIVANILAGTLGDLASGLTTRLGAGGRIVLSGILKNQAMVVLNRYRALGLRLERRLVLGNWVTLILTR